MQAIDHINATAVCFMKLDNNLNFVSFSKISQMRELISKDKCRITVPRNAKFKRNLESFYGIKIWEKNQRQRKRGRNEL